MADDEKKDEVESSETPAVVEYGCAHYARKCSFVSPCCDKIYSCRLCHDEKELHQIDRHAVKFVVCQICNTIQSIVNNCVKCGVEFGRYHCGICRMYDDKDKQQFHCNQCGICRVGGRENFFHCPKCDMCLSTSLLNSHKCIEKACEGNCPVCLDGLHSSLLSMHVPKCGHIMHFKCWTEMLKSGNYACAVCCQSTTDLSNYWRQLDEEIAATPMPDDYKDTKFWILCRDCQKKSNTQFHVLGLKCVECGSYNTCRDAEPAAASVDV